MTKFIAIRRKQTLSIKRSDGRRTTIAVRSIALTVKPTRGKLVLKRRV